MGDTVGLAALSGVGGNAPNTCESPNAVNQGQNGLGAAAEAISLLNNNAIAVLGEAESSTNTNSQYQNAKNEGVSCESVNNVSANHAAR
ncbi:hypothetical protein ACWCPS_37440 [Streptomyces mauvecolor]